MLINKLWDLLTSTLLVEMKEPQLHFFFQKILVFKKPKTLGLTLGIRTSRWLKTIKELK